MFVPRSLEQSIPTIRQEQVLIVYDRAEQRQHFVREVNFEAGDGDFGFIVPTPKQPEVAAAKSPFKALSMSARTKMVPIPKPVRPVPRRVSFSCWYRDASAIRSK